MGQCEMQRGQKERGLMGCGSAHVEMIGTREDLRPHGGANEQAVKQTKHRNC